LNIALKEWASVVAALESGLQVCLLRKGGIIEADRGGFHLRHRRFLLFPTYEHEHTKMLQDRHAGLLIEPDFNWHDISLLCEVTDVFTTHGLDQLRAGSQHFVWNDAFLRKRVDYRPELPLYCIVVRAYRLPERVRIPDRRSYAGCKSWMHLTEDIEVAGATPVLSDREFSLRRDALVDALTGHIAA
jgi:hypothetical protein